MKKALITEGGTVLGQENTSTGDDGLHVLAGAGLKNPTERLRKAVKLSAQLRRMVCDMVPHESGNKVVPVIVAGMSAQRER